ncbi:MAG TPA: PmoA family protein [Chitinophagaceae bacterium]|jgi:hypothetical protein|nr:PmoA family protein [Chitinophagaceae bacterium]
MRKHLILILFFFSYLVSTGQQNTGFQFVPKNDKQQIDILYNGKLLTAYCYYDSVYKPVLYPIHTVEGISVTRGYPVNPSPGDRTDHPHHVGLWMNYESVNGLDFWNNSNAIAADKKDRYGTIRHDKVVVQNAQGDMATLIVTANWHRPDGKILLKETTTYLFRVRGSQFFIDRTSNLRAQDLEVVFKDVKDGMLAIRVARELEMPSKDKAEYIDANGIKTTVEGSTAGVTGMYYNSDGVKGDSVWSTKGKWAMLKGVKGGKDITIGIFDHPKNVGYPAYWHARGYGLFALNPLGRKVFSNGKEDLNFTLQPNKSTTFQYRILIATGKGTNAAEMDRLAADFGR